MATLGGSLKLREKLTGRYADVLSWLYLASSVLRRYEAEGYPKEQRDVFEWAMQYCMVQIQEGFDGIFANFKVPFLGWLFSGPLAFWSRLNSLGRMPKDDLGHKVAQAVQLPGGLRDQLTKGIIVSAKPGDYADILEKAFTTAHQSAAILKTIQKAVKAKKLPKKRANLLVDDAVKAGVISAAEGKTVEEANQLRDEAIKVDSFTLEEYKQR
jgi:acyl-CoA dehydrogenase